VDNPAGCILGLGRSMVYGTGFTVSGIMYDNFHTVLAQLRNGKELVVRSLTPMLQQESRVEVHSRRSSTGLGVWPVKGTGETLT
jgi:hypothetical protein